MFSFFDERFTVADDTLLMYTGDEKEVRIPSSVRGHRIRKIGCNALLRNPAMTSIAFEEGITELGRSLFSGCESLKTVALPSTLETIGMLNDHGGTEEWMIAQKMSPGEIQALTESSFRTRSGIYIIPPSALPKETAGKAAALKISLTSLITDTAPLFSEKKFLLSESGEPDTPLIWQAESSPEIRSEQEGVLLDIARGSGAQVSAAQEADADWHFICRKGKAVSPNKQAIACFSEKDITPDGWNYILNIHFLCAYYFRQRVQGVMLGSMYYVYSRYYTFSSGTYRVDIAVLNAEGEMVKDEKTVGEVYGKYKLPLVF